MTNETEVPFSPDFFQTITDVSFGSGVIFVNIGYNARSDTQQPPRPSIQLVTPPFGSERDAFGRVDLLLPDVVTPVPVTNPVTSGMLSTYLQWTPAAVSESRDHSDFPPVTTYWARNETVIHARSTTLGVPEPPPVTPENAGQIWNIDNGFLPGPPGTANATVAEWNINGSPGLYSSLADIQAEITFLSTPDHGGVSPGGDRNAGDWVISSFQASPPLTTFVLTGSIVFEINYNHLKSAILANNKNSPITFEVDVQCRSVGDISSASVGLTAEVYKKLRNFTLDKNNNPTFHPWGGIPPLPTSADGGKAASGSVSAVNGGSASQKITVTIDPKSLNVTVTVQ